MAKYTAKLNEIVQINNGEIETIFDSLLSDYELFDPTYRETLNKKIIKHYYFHEIGFETAERFVFEINRKMDEIMVYYNQLYKSEIDINPFVNFRKSTSVAESSDDSEVETINLSVTDNSTTTDNETTTETEDEVLSIIGNRDDVVQNDTTATRNKLQSTSGLQDTTNENELSNTGTVKDVKSDTPTSQLLGGDISGDYYASEVSVNNSTNNTNQTTIQNIAESQLQDVSENDETAQTQTTTSDLTSDTTKDNDKTRVNEKTSVNDKTSSNEQEKDNKKSSSRSQYINDEGITISESELLMRYRETFLNIDMDIINELKTMFMLIV